MNEVSKKTAFLVTYPILLLGLVIAWVAGFAGYGVQRCPASSDGAAMGLLFAVLLPAYYWPITLIVLAAAVMTMACIPYLSRLHPLNATVVTICTGPVSFVCLALIGSLQEEYSRCNFGF